MAIAHANPMLPTALPLNAERWGWRPKKDWPATYAPIPCNFAGFSLFFLFLLKTPSSESSSSSYALAFPPFPELQVRSY